MKLYLIFTLQEGYKQSLLGKGHGHSLHSLSTKENKRPSVSERRTLDVKKKRIISRTVTGGTSLCVCTVVPKLATL